MWLYSVKDSMMDYTYNQDNSMIKWEYNQLLQIVIPTSYNNENRKENTGERVSVLYTHTPRPVPGQLTVSNHL